MQSKKRSITKTKNFTATAWQLQ